jgi:anti-sigma factor RsiW
MNNDHLTSEEMEALLSDLQAKEPQDRAQHLEVCPQCLAEVESLRGTLEDLRTAATASAEYHRRVAVMPAPSYRTPRMMWSLLAAMALICIAVPVTVHQKRAGVTMVSAPVQAPQVTVSVAVTDEQVWNSIQDDLSSSVPKPLLPLAAASTDSTTSTDNTKEN